MSTSPTPFLEGYRRKSEEVAKILSALVKAMDRHPQLRLGQLLYVVLNQSFTAEHEDHDEIDRAIGHKLFFTYDEDLEKALNNF
jgi:hypothetical protein